MIKKIKKSLEDAFYYLEVLKRDLPETELKEEIEGIQLNVKNALYDLEKFLEKNKEKSLKISKELLELLG